jgi:hypothetical protein
MFRSSGVCSRSWPEVSEAEWVVWQSRCVPDLVDTLSARLGSLMGELDRAEPTELVAVCGAWLERHLGAQSCVLLLADYSETSLAPVPSLSGTTVSGTTQPHEDVDGSLAGRAFREQRAVHADAPAQPGGSSELTLTFVPVSMRLDRLGVLAVTQPAGERDETQSVLDDVAQLLAYVLTGARDGAQVNLPRAAH